MRQVADDNCELAGGLDAAEDPEALRQSGRVHRLLNIWVSFDGYFQNDRSTRAIFDIISVLFDRKCSPIAFGKTVGIDPRTAVKHSMFRTSDQRHPKYCPYRRRASQPQHSRPFIHGILMHFAVAIKIKILSVKDRILGRRETLTKLKSGRSRNFASVVSPYGQPIYKPDSTGSPQ
jgi:hypothetical protein